MSLVLLHQTLAFAMAYALVAVLPGPNLVVVAAASQMSGRLGGLKAAAGVALGASVLAALTALAASRTGSLGPPATDAGALLFGLLLSAIGWRVLAASFVAPPRGPARRVASASLLTGFATAIANPISAGFFASYALSAEGRAAGPAVLGMAVSVFVVAALWFGAVGFWLDRAPARGLGPRHSRRLQTLCGIALIAFGLGKIAGLLLD